VGIDRPLLLDIPPEFVGERVVVRPYREEDTEAVFSAIAESEGTLTPWMPWAGTHRTPADTREFIRRTVGRFILREELTLGVFLREGGDYLGSTGIIPRDWQIPVFEIGYWLRDSAVGKGYMSEAVRLQTAYCFDGLGAQRVEIRCDARNERSRAIPQRLGFALEATLRNNQTATDGSVRTSEVWAMTPEDYAAARTRWGGL